MKRKPKVTKPIEQYTLSELIDRQLELTKRLANASQSDLSELNNLISESDKLLAAVQAMNGKIAPHAKKSSAKSSSQLKTAALTPNYLQLLLRAEPANIGEMYAIAYLTRDSLTRQALVGQQFWDVLNILMKMDMVPRNKKLLEPGVNRLSDEYLKEFVVNNPQ